MMGRRTDTAAQKNGETPDLVLNGIPQVRKTSGRESDNGISGRILNRVTGDQDKKFGDRDTSRQASAKSLRDGEKQSMTNEKKPTSILADLTDPDNPKTTSLQKPPTLAVLATIS